MSHSNRNEARPAAPNHRGPISSLYRAVATEAAMVWAWAVAPWRRLLAAMLREAVRPPTRFQGLPPGSFPPMSSVWEELLGVTDGDQAKAAAFIARPACGRRIPTRRGEGGAS